MKKTSLKICAGILALLMACSALISCGGGKISGTYLAEGEVGSVELTFSGNKLKLKETIDWSFGADPSSAQVDEYDMTYKVNGDKITLYSKTIKPGYAHTLDASGSRYFAEHSFEMTDEYIKIGKNTYYKK